MDLLLETARELNTPVGTGKYLGRWTFCDGEVKETRGLANCCYRGAFGEKVVINGGRVRVADTLACYVVLAEGTL